MARLMDTARFCQAFRWPSASKRNSARKSIAG
jgi:hypothetical protein